jgi:ABC-type xylose transport system substrate-binding protein
MAGTWKLNAAKSTFSPGPAPKSMTIVYTPADDMLTIAVDVEPATGAAQKWAMTAAYDGKDHPVTGNPDADTISMKRINETTGESTFKKGGKVMAVNTRVLSADGKTLTITTKGTTSDGKPRHDVAVYDKQP